MCNWEVVTFIHCWHSWVEWARYYIVCVTRQEIWHFGSGVYSTSCPIGTRSSLPRFKCPECEGNLSSLSSVKVKNAWSFTSTVLLCVHGVMLTQTRKWRKNMNESYIFPKIQFHTRLQNPALNDICSAPLSDSSARLISTVNEKVQ